MNAPRPPQSLEALQNRLRHMADLLEVAEQAHRLSFEDIDTVALLVDLAEGWEPEALLEAIAG